MSWTEERISALCRLWSDGLSAAEIGRRLEVSKNAVIGKAHRLGLPGRPSPIKRNKSTTTKVRAESAGPATQQRSQARTCCWPFGDPEDPDFHFCGNKAMKNKPYCEEHYKIAYIQARPRHRDS